MKYIHTKKTFKIHPCFGDIFNKDISIEKFVDDVFDSSLFTSKKKEFNVDIIEDDEKIIIKAELPGVKKSDLDVDFKGGILIITAEKTEDEQKDCVRKESRSGILTRSFSVGDIDSENVNASYIDGILTISMNKQSTSNKVNIS